MSFTDSNHLLKDAKDSVEGVVDAFERLQASLSDATTANAAEEAAIPEPLESGIGVGADGDETKEEVTVSEAEAEPSVIPAASEIAAKMSTSVTSVLAAMRLKAGGSTGNHENAAEEKQVDKPTVSASEPDEPLAYSRTPQKKSGKAATRGRLTPAQRRKREEKKTRKAPTTLEEKKLLDMPWWDARAAI